MLRKRLIALVLVLMIFTISFPTSISNAASNKARLNIQKLTLTKGTSYVLRVYNTKPDQHITFSVKSSSILSYEKNIHKKTFEIKGKNAGTAVVTVTLTEDSQVISKLTCTVLVTPPPISIHFSKRKIVIENKASMFLPIIVKPNTALTTATYTSSNPMVVTVNSKGRITAIRKGTAILTATLASGQSATCTVKVVNRKFDPE